MTAIGPWAPVMVTVRAETSDDQGAIFDVHAAAFPPAAEARLVNALRAAGKATVSLVAEVDATVVGHVLFTPVRLEPGPGSCLGVGLAPLAVWPALQRRGIGSRLVDTGLEACCRAGFGFVVVLGEPRYYHRFGFRHALTAGLRNEYGVDEEFMVLELQPGALIGASGVVRYGPEFAAVAAG